MRVRTIFFAGSLLLAACASTPQQPELAVKGVVSVPKPVPVPCLKAGTEPVLAGPPDVPDDQIDKNAAWVKVRMQQVQQYVNEVRAVLAQCTSVRPGTAAGSAGADPQ